MAVLAFGLVVLIGSFGGGKGPGGATVKVVVAARDIPIRAQITKEDLALADFAQSDAPPRSYSKVDDVLRGGLIAELNVAKGQPLTENMLAKSGDVIPGTQPAFLPIPQGFVALTIPTGEQQGVAGFIQPGDYISIQAQLTTSVFAQGQPKTVIKTVFTNLHVLRTGPAVNNVQPAGGGQQQQQAAPGGLTSSLTVVTTACDAEFLHWFLNNAVLKYELESFKDYQPQDTKVDAACANVNAAKGVSASLVDQRFGFTKLP
jgi:pilus assembly protein CpaB